MATDITRNTFDRSKHYSSVRKQQGRVDIDADLNELNDILQYQDRTTRADVIGRAGGPVNGAGFEITSEGGLIKISKGHYYVDGILAENENAVDYGAQPDLPFPEDSDPYSEFDNGKYLFYLDVWERPITALEDPGIREVALGGPDHGTRTQVIAQVRALQTTGLCSDFQGDWSAALANPNVRMQARVKPGPESTDPCKVPASAGYRSLENQLYRVEIKEEGVLGAAKFVWSRENASVVARWESQSGDFLTISGYIRDTNLGFSTGDLIELIDDERELRGEAGVFVKVVNAVDDQLEVPVGSVDINDFQTNKRVRRWDCEALLTVGDPATMDADGYQDLEYGVQVRFTNGNDTDATTNLPLPSTFRVGDHWMAAARVNGAKVEWPDDGLGSPKQMPPYGVIHHYARLALATFTPAAGEFGASWHVETDCRCLFPPLCDLPDDDCCCCEITVGDGETSHGDFDNILDAIAEAKRLNDEQDKDLFHHICLLPGEFDLARMLANDERGSSVTIEGLRMLISGCKGRTTVIAVEKQPAFVAIRCPQFEMRDLEVQAASADGAVITINCSEVNLHDLTIINKRAANPEVLAFNMHVVVSGSDKLREGTGPAIAIQGGQHVEIEDNKLFGTPALQLVAKDVLVRDNYITAGGVKCDMSDFVRYTIASNQIEQGVGAGVLLFTEKGATEGMKSKAGRSMATIRGNSIRLMSMAGIASDTPGNADNAEITRMGRVTVADNTILGCGISGVDGFDGLGTGGVIIGNTDAVTISDNHISHCGLGKVAASGIQVFRSMGVSITDNTIEDNGIAVSDDEKSGIQAGIAALFVGAPTASVSLGAAGKNTVPSGNALTVHGNRVSTPAGPALWSIALGPVSVQDNTFQSRGVFAQAFSKKVYPIEKEIWGLSLRGTVISILDLGLASELPAVANPEAFLKEFGMLYMEDVYTSLPPGTVLCGSNTSHFLCTTVVNSKKGVMNTFIVSFDDLRLNDNVLRTDIPEGIDLTVANRTFSFTGGLGGNRFQESTKETIASLVAIAGWVSITDNIATHCLYGHAAVKELNTDNIIMQPIGGCDTNAFQQKARALLDDYKTLSGKRADPSATILSALGNIVKAL